ncbi:MAG: hypothetical protein AAF399_04055, partial [Bacteroidota bacterium]
TPTGKKLRAGDYMLTAIPNDAANRAGNDGIMRKFPFTLVNKNAAVAAFQLWDGDADSIITELKQGDVVELADLANRSFNIIAEANATSGVESMRLRLFGLGKGNRKDSDAPYTQFKRLDGKTFTAGEYTIQAFPYSMDNAKGDALPTSSIDFTLAEAGAQAPAREITLIDAEEATEMFMVYPNPTAATLNFNKQTSVAIYNEMGQRIAVYQNTKQINVADFKEKVGASQTFFMLPANGDRAVRVLLSNN